MENFYEMQRWPWSARAERARRPRGFTMWTPQDTTGPDEGSSSRGDSRHGEFGKGEFGKGEFGKGEFGKGERGHGGRGRRGGPHQRSAGPVGFGPGGFGPGGNLGRGRGRGGRGRRGDVRAAVLLLLDESPMHGYELIQQIVAKSDGAWKPSPGSIYPALSQLEDEGLVLIDKVDGRKTARLTEAGRAYVTTHRGDLGSPWDDVKGSVGDDAMDLRGLIGLLMGAAGQVAAVGNPAQVKQAGDVLADARRRLYRILAEDDRANPDAHAEAGDTEEPEA